MRKFWNFRADARNAAHGELYLYGEISDVSWWGDEVTPKQFAEDLAALGDIKTLDIYINSPGGDVFAGMTIYNILLRSTATKTVHVDGLAASAASIVAMAGDEIIIPENATIMIHKAWSMAQGNADAMRRMAEELDRVDGQLAGIYEKRRCGTADEWMERMAAESWYTGQEAVDIGLADRTEERKEMAAMLTPRIAARYLHTPAGIVRNAVETVHLVYGPPCSGKSTYAREHAAADDVIYDYDALIRAITNRETHEVEKTVAHNIALGIRGLLISDIHKEDTLPKNAWIITTYPSDHLREQLDGLSIEELRMDVSREECLARLEADEARTDKKAWRDLIEAWFAEHGGAPTEPSNGGNGQPVDDSHPADPEVDPEEPVSTYDAQRARFAAMRRKIFETIGRD